MVTKIPEFVYLVTVDTEWPVSVIIDYGPQTTPEAVAHEVGRRLKGWRPDQVKVWRARLTDVREVDFIPATVVPPSLTLLEP